jgi:hypothetical protein
MAKQKKINLDNVRKVDERLKKEGKAKTVNIERALLKLKKSK